MTTAQERVWSAYQSDQARLRARLEVLQSLAKASLASFPAPGATTNYLSLTKRQSVVRRKLKRLELRWLRVYRKVTSRKLRGWEVV